MSLFDDAVRSTFGSMTKVGGGQLSDSDLVQIAQILRDKGLETTITNRMTTEFRGQ